MQSTRARLAWRIENVKQGKSADIQVYGGIGDPWDGVDSAAFAKDVRALDGDVERFNFLFNSPGGYVSDGLAMFNVISGLKADTWGYVEGSADSAASFVFQAIKNRVIAKNATMFIHRAQGIAVGDEDDALALHELLKEHSRAIAQIYADRAGGTVDDWLSRMAAAPLRGTQYRGQEAVDAGLADSVGLYVANHAPGRVAAHVGEPVEAPAPIDLAAAMQAARLSTPTPTLQQLIEQHQTEPLTAAIGKETR